MPDCLHGLTPRQKARGIMDNYDAVFEHLAKMLPLEDFNHACTVAAKCRHLKRTCVVAFLHDVVEDGYSTFEELQQRFDLDNKQMAALDAITRRQGEKYFDYIQHRNMKHPEESSHYTARMM